MKTLKLILTAILLMVAYVANAQTIKVYKDGAVVKEYSSAEVDSVVYKPAAAEPRYYYYAGWDCPTSVETDDKYLVKLVNEANGTNSVGGFVTTITGEWLIDTDANNLINPNGIRRDTVYVVFPKDLMNIYDADGAVMKAGNEYDIEKLISLSNVEYVVCNMGEFYRFGTTKIK